MPRFWARAVALERTAVRRGGTVAGSLAAVLPSQAPGAGAFVAAASSSDMPSSIPLASTSMSGVVA